MVTNQDLGHPGGVAALGLQSCFPPTLPRELDPLKEKSRQQTQQREEEEEEDKNTEREHDPV